MTVDRDEQNPEGWAQVAGYDDQDEIANTAAGRKWIKDHGEDGKKYRVIRVTAAVKVETITVTKRLLV